MSHQNHQILNPEVYKVFQTFNKFIGNVPIYSHNVHLWFGGISFENLTYSRLKDICDMLSLYNYINLSCHKVQYNEQ